MTSMTTGRVRKSKTTVDAPLRVGVDLSETPPMASGGDEFCGVFRIRFVDSIPQTDGASRARRSTKTSAVTAAKSGDNHRKRPPSVGCCIGHWSAARLLDGPAALSCVVRAVRAMGLSVPSTSFPPSARAIHAVRAVRAVRAVYAWAIRAAVCAVRPPPCRRVLRAVIRGSASSR